jgi:hypothetical protein
MTFWRIWQGSRRPGTCKYCRAAIVWVITSTNQALPFNPHERRLREERHPVTGARFDVFSSAALHLTTCPKQPARAHSR